MSSIIKYSFYNVIKRKLRSFLTILSIIIGISAISTLVSFGMGINNYIETVGEEAGTDKIFLYSLNAEQVQSVPSYYLSEDEIKFVSNINGVKDITRMYVRASEIGIGKEIRWVPLFGYEPEKSDLVEEAFTLDVMKGRSLKKNDLNKVVLGHSFSVENRVFNDPIFIGQKISIQNVPMRVVGFFSEIGNPSDDRSIYISTKKFEELFPKNKGKYTYSLIKTVPGTNASLLAGTIKEKLRKYNNQESGEEDFTVQSFEDAVEAFSSIINLFNAVVVTIGAISMIVAAVNITNTMFTSVLERTKEIGIMKSIGGTNFDIFKIFLYEASILGLFGGIIGSLLGFLISRTAGVILVNFGFSSLKPLFTLELAFFCVLFAILVSVVSSIIPAFKASKQKPVDSLRYE